MAKMIKMWRLLGPRLAPTTPMQAEEVIETLVNATNQSRGSVLAIQAELDVVLEQALKAGRIVHMPNGTHYRPHARRDGSIRISVKLPKRLVKNINKNFRGRYINADNIGKSEAELVALWNQTYPDDPIEE
jgi:hypothetical protein